MKYYCLGIKGSGMSTLAQILFDLGNEVSGYDDAKEYKFTQKGTQSSTFNFLTTDLLKVFYLSKKERARKTSSNKMEVSMQ